MSVTPAQIKKIENAAVILQQVAKAGKVGSIEPAQAKKRKTAKKATGGKTKKTTTKKRTTKKGKK